MIDFAAIETAIGSWAESTMGLKVYWRGRKRPMLPKTPAYCTLQFDVVASRGVDELRYAQVPPDVEPQVGGIRQATVNVRVRSRSQEPNQSARYFLELAKLSLQDPAERQVLTDAGIAIETIGQTNTIDADFQGRLESIAEFELTIGLASTRTGAAVGTLEEVVLTSHVEDEAGNEYPSPPNFDDETLP